MTGDEFGGRTRERSLHRIAHHFELSILLEVFLGSVFRFSSLPLRVCLWMVVTEHIWGKIVENTELSWQDERASRSVATAQHGFFSCSPLGTTAVPLIVAGKHVERRWSFLRDGVSTALVQTEGTAAENCLLAVTAAYGSYTERVIILLYCLCIPNKIHPSEAGISVKPNLGWLYNSSQTCHHIFQWIKTWPIAQIHQQNHLFPLWHSSFTALNIMMVSIRYV